MPFVAPSPPPPSSLSFSPIQLTPPVSPLYSYFPPKPRYSSKLSADNLSRNGEASYSAVDNWYRTRQTHEELAVTGSSERSDRAREREREMEWRRAEERKNRRLDK